MLLGCVAALGLGQATMAQPVPSLPSVTSPAAVPDESKSLTGAAKEAEQRLHQTFTNLRFEDFGPAPIEGPIYQASAGGRILYYAPQSDHLLFATVYDRNGVNVTALAESARASKQVSAIDPAQALAIGPPDAPTVIEFTDPECPYCRALERFWAAKAAEGKPVRRLIYFVSGIHPQAAARSEHILCSPDPAATFTAIYGGASPTTLATCEKGHAKVIADAALVARVGITGTPTLIVDGKLVSGFQQGELEAFVAAHAKAGTSGAAASSTAAAPSIKPALHVR
jgi:thiol:disulfide interchange protein DsbC